ncbi:MAG: DegT/DnrJ/EryC1/StrS family aminotransferase [Planctomycetota bacterium]
MRSVTMLDLKAEYALFRDEIRAVVEETLDGQQFIGGPAIGQLERDMQDRFGFHNAIAVSSGTDAILCTLMALGVGAGDEVVLPAFTFFATAGTVARLGAKPVFVDIDAGTFNVTPAAVEAAVTSRTRTVIVVHLFGQCADMDAINAMAAKRNLAVIEDAAQAIGATYHGRNAGTLGTIGCFSFYPTKNLGGFGEGGLITTGDAELAAVVRQLRNHGESRRYHHERVGGNFRLDTMKAAILGVKLRRLEELNRRRRANAAAYDRLLAGAPVVRPCVAHGCGHVYHQYSILSDRRDELAAYLRDRGVGTGIYYPIPLHRQPCFAGLGYAEGSLPVTEETCRRILSIPCHPMLTEEDVRYVAGGILEFHAAEKYA